MAVIWVFFATWLCTHLLNSKSSNVDPGYHSRHWILQGDKVHRLLRRQTFGDEGLKPAPLVFCCWSSARSPLCNQMVLWGTCNKFVDLSTRRNWWVNVEIERSVSSLVFKSLSLPVHTIRRTLQPSWTVFLGRNSDRSAVGRQRSLSELLIVITPLSDSSA